MKKNFIIDTNVILQDPHCIYSFDNNDVYVTTSVLAELDRVKSKNGDLAQSARMFSRLIGGLLDEQEGNIISLGKRFGQLHLLDDTSLFSEYTDDNLIVLAKKLQSLNNNQYIIVSNDVNLKLKARAVGVEVQRYSNIQVSINKKSGIRVVENIDDEVIDFIYNSEEGVVKVEDDNCVANEYLVLKSVSGKSAIVRVVKYCDGFYYVLVNDIGDVYGITPKNAEQRCLIDALLSSDIELVVCDGVAGTGKTLLSMATALALLERKKYNKILIYKSIIPFGNDIGYLKGDKEDKLRSWLQPFYDNLEYIFENGESLSKKGKSSGSYEYLFDAGMIEIDALTYIRGRSIPKRFIIIDEVQNLSQKEIKTILTRVGEQSKLVLLGDTQQIDNLYLDEQNNALAYVSEKMRGYPNVAILSMTKSERSKLAQLAIDVLK